jgi:LmbE family N-acetylglucosaminyl deacetylase
MTRPRAWVAVAVTCLLLFLRAPARAADCVPLTVGQGERLLVVAPHPDDETIGAGGLIRRVREQGGTVRVALMTAGDGYVEAVVHETGLPRPRPTQFIAYGERRLREARAALHVLDGDRLRLQFLGFPDGGLEGLLRSHWSRRHPERSPTTGASDPPYDADAVEPNVPYDGDDLRRELLNVLRETNPTIVVLPDPVDKHPDHRATGLFTLLALHDWLTTSGKTGSSMPRLLAYLVHWPDWPPGWNAATPSPQPDVPLVLPSNLPPRKLECVTLTLTNAEVATKQAALHKYTTQQDVMSVLLAAFVRRTEPFTVLTPDQMRHVGRMIEPRRARRNPSPGHRKSKGD